MKKTYKNPTLKVVKTRGARLLTGSDPKLGGTYKGGTILSRESRFSDWDDEE